MGSDYVKLQIPVKLVNGITQGFSLNLQKDTKTALVDRYFVYKKI